ncbi:MAG: hypothetical protein AAGJ94_03240 [Pseudomonadota bacterium]
MTLHHAFEVLIAIHITLGAPGLVCFWLPVMVKKGGPQHRLWGRIFVVSMLGTATTAVMMATLSVIAPMPTHPHLMEHPQFSDPQLVRVIFGWMMLYLAILTINLAWYAWSCSRNKRDEALNRRPLNVALQVVLTVAAANCAYQGYLLGEPLVMGFSIVGFATVATNVHFMYRRNPRPIDWLLEHIKAIIGTGISVYTAFFAFGAVRIMPEAALSPMLWSVPLVTGLILIIYHQRKVLNVFNRRLAGSVQPAKAALGAK